MTSTKSSMTKVYPHCQVIQVAIQPYPLIFLDPTGYYKGRGVWPILWSHSPAFLITVRGFSSPDQRDSHLMMHPPWYTPTSDSLSAPPYERVPTPSIEPLSFRPATSTPTSSNITTSPKQIQHSLFTCNISYHVFCRDNAKRKVIWKQVKPTSNLSIDVTSNAFTWEGFRESVVNKCSQDNIYMAKILNDFNFKFDWMVYIPKVKGWSKTANPHSIHDAPSFHVWISAISQFKSKNAGVIIKMEDPRLEENQRRNEDLLARSVRQAEAIKSMTSGTGLVNPNSMALNGVVVPHFTTFDTYQDQLYHQYTQNDDYNLDYPVYLDPVNKELYVVLTPQAKALCDRVAGVSLDSPPGTLPLLNRREVQRQQKGAASTSNNLDAATLVNVISSLVKPQEASEQQIQQHIPQKRELSPPSSICGQPAGFGIIDYLQFCRIGRQLDKTLQILEDNDIDSYKMLRSVYYSEQELKDIGLASGVIKKLQWNIRQYEDHLLSQNAHKSQNAQDDTV